MRKLHYNCTVKDRANWCLNMDARGRFHVILNLFCELEEKLGFSCAFNVFGVSRLFNRCFLHLWNLFGVFFLFSIFFVVIFSKAKGEDFFN